MPKLLAMILASGEGRRLDPLTREPHRGCARRSPGELAEASGGGGPQDACPPVRRVRPGQILSAGAWATSWASSQRLTSSPAA